MNSTGYFRQCFKEEFGKMGSLSEAVIYAPEKISSLVSDFWKSYTDLPEVLKRQGLNDENKAWFLQSICWSKQRPVGEAISLILQPSL